MAAYQVIGFNEINTLRWNYSSVSTCNDDCRFRNHATAQLMADNATMAGNMTGGNMTGSNMTEGNATGSIACAGGYRPC